MFIATSLLQKLWAPVLIFVLAMAGVWLVHHTAFERGYDSCMVEQSDAMQEALRLQAQQHNESVLEAVVISEVAAREIAAANRLQQDLQKRMRVHLDAQYALPLPEKSHASLALSDRPLIGQSVVDPGTVSLLNAARLGRAPEELPGAAPGAAEEVGTAPPAYTYIPSREFVANDLQVVKQYHELATRHDSLVDWVIEKLIKVTP